ncbi:MAG: hypothetical protein HYR84_04015 [Planctomycetes bacterium]|nr:hypothetical protein [Planctomycetota bacterium]
MKRFGVLFSLALIMVAVGAACGQEVPKLQVPPIPPPPPGGLAQPIGQPVFANGLISPAGLMKLKLTAEQNAEFEKLNVEYMKNRQQLRLKFSDPIASPTPEAAKELKDSYEKLRPDYLAKVEKLLNADQKKLFAEVSRQDPNIGAPPIFGPPPRINPLPGFGPPVGAAFLPAEAQQRLKLSDEQKKKVDGIQKELEAKILGVLTEDQKKTFDEMKKQRGGAFPMPFLPAPVPPAIFPPPGANPAFEQQLKDLIRDVEELRKEVRELKKRP